MRPFIMSHADDIQVSGTRDLTPEEFDRVFGGGDTPELDPGTTYENSVTIVDGKERNDPIVGD